VGLEILTEDDLTKFQRDGYLTIDPEIPTEVIDEVVEEMAPKYTEKGTRHEDGVIYQKGRITHPSGTRRMRGGAKA
jgi:hypothetical protein